MSKKERKEKILFWVITLITPFIILFILEMGLRVFNYNEEGQNLFVEIPDHPELLVSNPNFFQRYFPSFAPKVAPTPFLKKKGNNTYRIFVLGGSSTEGFPYNFYNSFSARMKQKFDLETQGIKFEVINLGITAVNSYVVWDLRKRISDFEPDAIVLYTGHNEYYGSFGVGSKQFQLGENRWIKRLIINLKDFHLYQWIESLISPSNQPQTDRTMMSLVVKDSQIEYGSETFKSGLSQFEANIFDFIKFFENRDTDIYIGSIASNLRDQEPLGENGESIEVFKVAQKALSNGNIDSALVKFKLAKDLDEIRFRAPTELNNIIASIAKRTNSNFVDIEQIAIESSDEGIPGNDLFIDHLHPNWKMNSLIGEAFFDTIIKKSVISKYYLPNELSKRPQLSDFEEAYASIAIDRLESGFPFKKGLSQGQEQKNFKLKYRDYLAKSVEDSIAAKAWLERKPVSNVLREVIERNIENRDTLSLVKNSIALVNWYYFNEQLLKVGISYSVNSRKLDSYNVLLLHSILNKRRKDTYFVNLLAGIYMLNEDFNRAEYWLNESKRVNPNSSELLLNYSRFYILQGDTVTATSYLQRYRLSLSR